VGKPLREDESRGLCRSPVALGAGGRAAATEICGPHLANCRVMGIRDAELFRELKASRDS